MFIKNQNGGNQNNIMLGLARIRFYINKLIIYRMFKVFESFVRSMIRRLFLQTSFVSFQRNYFITKMKIHYSCTSKTATLPLLSFAVHFQCFTCHFRATFGNSAVQVYLIIVERSMHPLVSELFLLYPYVSRCSLVP